MRVTELVREAQVNNANVVDASVVDPDNLPYDENEVVPILHPAPTTRAERLKALDRDISLRQTVAGLKVKSRTIGQTW